MNYLFGVLVALGGMFFVLNPEVDMLMKVTSCGISVIALLYLFLRLVMSKTYAKTESPKPEEH